MKKKFKSAGKNDFLAIRGCVRKKSSVVTVALCRIYPSKKKDMHRHEKFDHGDDLSTRLTTLVEKLEMLMTTISRNQGLNMGPNS